MRSTPKIKNGRLVIFLFFVFIVLTSSAETYYISSSGNDANSGTSVEFPWKSLEKINSHSFSPGDRILFKRGEQWTGTIILNSSGTAGNPILYGAYGSGAKPILKGSAEVTGWTRYSGNIYKSSADNLNINQVFEDGTKIKISRFPATGYIQVDNVSDKITFSISELDGKPENYWAGATLIMRNVDWSFEARKIIASKGAYITLENAPRYNVSSGNNVFVINHIGGITTPGQWTYNESSNALYAWLKGSDDPSGHLMQASRIDYGFLGSGLISYVTIQDFDIREFRKDAIYLSGLSSNVSVINNTITHNYECGIQVYGSKLNNRITIKNNVITGSNRDGIRVQGDDLTISENTIKDISLIENIGLNAFVDPFNTACGIYAYSSENTVISYNNLKNIGYNGIMFFGQNNAVEYNMVDRACLSLQDGAGIYTHRSSNGSSIRFNIVANSGPGYSTASNGIYLDDATQGVTVEKNTCFGNNGNGLFLHNVANVNVLGNTIYNNKKQFYVKADNYSELIMSNNVASENIFYSIYENQMTVDFSDIQESGLGIKTFNNFYGNPVNPASIVVNYKAMVLDKFKTFPDWGSGAKELPGLLKFYEIEDTLSSNYVTNGDFHSDNSNWYGGEWVTGILDGGSHKRVATRAASAIQHKEFNIPVNKETQFYITMDVASANSSNTGRVLVGSIEVGKLLIDSEKRNMSYLFSTSEPITSRLTLDVWGEIGDIIYVDNVKMYKVKAKTIDPLEKSKLFYNATKSTQVIKLDGTYKNLDGDMITGSISLQPFTSQILIKESSSTVQKNQNPVIEGQSFDIKGTLQHGEFVGKVVASDPDVDQSLSYSIVSGNAENLFFMLPENGMIYTNSDLQFVADSTINLLVEVKDNASNPLSAQANMAVNVQAMEVRDKSAPTISSFTIPSTSTSLTISITSCTATDNYGIAGYLLTETPTPPGAGDERWTSCAPTSYTFSEYGTNTLYVWVKDYAGNVSGTAKAAITITDMTPVYTTEDIYTCEGNPYLGWTSSGQYTRTLQTSVGADSIVTTNLYVNPVYEVFEDVSIIEGDNYLGWTTAGKYTRTLSAVNGCDSIITTNLSVFLHAFTEEDISICEGESYQGWTTTGQYERTFQTVDGADSVVITNLYVNPVYHVTEDVAIFDNESYQGWSISGRYERNLTSVTGCDSIVTTNLTVHSSVYTVEDISICEGESYLGWTSGGQYERTLQTFAGADSVVRTNLYVNPVYRVSEEVTINEGESYFGWTAAGQYERTLSSRTGCDSLVSTNLTVIPQTITSLPVTQDINLIQEWNIFSSYVIPEGKSMESVVKDLIECGDLLQVVDQFGNTLEQSNDKSSAETWVNNIGDFSETQGYKIKIRSDCDLRIKGQKVGLPMDIDLNKGWNIISFPYDQSVNALDVVQPLIDNGELIKVQDESGNAIQNWRSREGWINRIGDFRPGEGYLVKVKQDCKLTIKEFYTKGSIVLANREEPRYFTPGYMGNGHDHMNINVDLSQSDFKIDDEIAAFDGDVCVGAVKITANDIINNSVELVASCADKGESNGFLNGNPVVLRGWKTGSNNATMIESLPLSGELVFREGGSLLVEIVNEITVGVNDIIDFEVIMYPNPTSSQITLEFSHFPGKDTKIHITDMTGKLLLSRQLQFSNEKFDVRSLPSGIYLIHINIGNKAQVKKFVKR